MHSDKAAAGSADKANQTPGKKQQHKQVQHSGNEISVGDYNLSAKTRKDNLTKILPHNQFDLVIIGGGITGAGIARDAASRGMKVALIEARDFAEGTSSRSSKLIHGGIRYLENLEFGLVFEALSERRLLFEIAPHLVHPLRFVLPLYRGGRVGMFKMGLGMWLYDALSLFEAPELHERLNPHETLDRVPTLRGGSDLLGSYVYSDAYMDDDLLVHETLRSAAAFGAVVVNHCAVREAKRDAEGRVIAVRCEDTLESGGHGLSQSSAGKDGNGFWIEGRHFISAVGPWTDRVAKILLGDSIAWRPLLRPSKGIHLTFSRDRLPLQDAVVMAADQEKRIVFAIPRHDMVIVGTTDTDFPDDPAGVSVTAKDVEYLLRIAGEYFPGAKLTEADVLACYAGVRPLIDDASESESKTSREHLIMTHPSHVTFVAGGKYTTYRRMAEQTVESALRSFPLEEQVQFRRNQTAQPLNPLVTLESLEDSRLKVEYWSKKYRIDQSLVSAWVERYGGETESLLELRQSKNLNSISVQLILAIRQSMCLRLVDFYIRRSHLFLAMKDHGLSWADHLSQVMAAELNWSDARRAEEVKTVRHFVEREMMWRTSSK